ncbi:hypothetical protein M8J75_010110 [Diaphorina citri]|nr:hypothetical protein M8J75_010110 [Diaphorina citri]
MDDSTMTENSDEMEYQEDEEEEEDDNDYYYNYDNYADSGGDHHNDGNDQNSGGADFETLQGVECLNVEQAKNLLNEHVDLLSSKLHISPSLAKLFLHLNEWNVNAIVQAYSKHTNAFLVENRVKPQLTSASAMDTLPVPTPSSSTSSPHSSSSKTSVCSVCTLSLPLDQFHSLTCGHPFCKNCWAKHFEVQINQGITLDISCMASQCNILASETLILTLLRPALHDKYESFSFRDFVSTHPHLRFCPGPNCAMVMKARESKPKRATCTSCHTSFCFQCGIEYHAPTDCAVIKKWLTKCADDSETANYISAHTKDCPKCHICIEKNGGCNHMQCYHCKHEFCWMCLGDWKQHGSEYYECSRYKENPNIGRESAHAQAREALKKYLHYYERWENHAKSLKLESAMLEKIRTRIHSKVMTSSGTWIDWQYLIDASTLLARCRYTLQYTYPYAYYMEPSLSHSRKELWKIERAETTDRGDLENQMDIAEKRRITLLKDFHLTAPGKEGKGSAELSLVS